MKTCPFACLPHMAQMPQKRILMVSSRSSRSHSMLRRLFLSSLVVQSISSLVAVDGSWRSSVHLCFHICSVAIRLGHVSSLISLQRCFRCV